MRYLKLYLGQIFIGIIFMLVMFICFNDRGESAFAGDVKEYNSEWYYSADGDEYIYVDELPEEFEVDDGYIILKKILDDDLYDSEVIQFYTSHERVYVYVEDNLIYSLEPSDSSRSKSPGNKWNVVDMKREYSGKTLYIRIESCYSKNNVALTQVYYGTKEAIILREFNEKIGALILSFIMLIIGIVIIIGCMYLSKRFSFPDGMIWLGIISVQVAVWSALETQIIPIFAGNNQFFSQLSFISLKLILIPNIQFVACTYEMKSDKTIKAISLAISVDFVCSCILQLLGIVDLKQTITVSHIIYAMAAAVIFYKIHLVFTKKVVVSRKTRRSITVHSLCIAGVTIAALIDLISYYLGLASDRARFTRVGLILYIVVLARILLDDSIKLLKAGEEATSIREAAMLDALTKLKNRAAFEDDMYIITKRNYKFYGIAMFDLNNLKYFNDMHGHSMGDYYIIVCSEVLQDVFGSEGNVYRIGGDEFCAIMKSVTYERYNELEQIMSEKIAALNGQYFENKMEVASGYAVYEKSLDSNLQDTIKRADKAMYRCKERLKGNVE